MFPQESQGLKNGELQLRVLRGTAQTGKAEQGPGKKSGEQCGARGGGKSRFRVLRRIKSSRMRRIDARTTVLGLLAATRVTIDAADGRAREVRTGEPVSSVELLRRGRAASARLPKRVLTLFVITSRRPMS